MSKFLSKPFTKNQKRLLSVLCALIFLILIIPKGISKEEYNQLVLERYEEFIIDIAELESVDCIDGDCSIGINMYISEVPTDLDTIVRGHSITLGNFEQEHRQNNNSKVNAYTTDGTSLMSCQAYQKTVKECEYQSYSMPL